MTKRMKNGVACSVGFVICDTLTIHHASLNCKLSRAVKFKSFILRVQGDWSWVCKSHREKKWTTCNEGTNQPQFFFTCNNVIGLFLNLSTFESWRPVLRKGLSVNLQRGTFQFVSSPFHHVTVMYLQKSWLFPVARQLSFYSQSMIPAWHFFVCFSNLLSPLSLSNSCRLNFF